MTKLDTPTPCLHWAGRRIANWLTAGKEAFFLAHQLCGNYHQTGVIRNLWITLFFFKTSTLDSLAEPSYFVSLILKVRVVQCLP